MPWDWFCLWGAIDMASFLRLCETCLFCLIGSFMVVLACSSEYWRYIHPKYSWLSITAGSIIILLGIATFFNRSKKARASELIAFLIFCIIAFASTSLPTPFMGAEHEAGLEDLGPEEPPLSFTGLPEPTQEQQSPRLTIDGKEYIKINQAELIVLDGDKRVQPGDRYVIQGSVVRTPVLDASGVVAVARLLITCCFADAAATAYLVNVPSPEAFENGEWVRVAGRIQTEAESLKQITLPVPGAITTVIGENYMLQSDEIQPDKPTGLPFLFQIRNQEPYAY